MTIVVLGGINEDVIALVEDLPRRGETIAAIGVERGAGGKGLNQAIAAARAGAPVLLLGAVGTDHAGEQLRDLMTREGIDTNHVAVFEDQPTGQALIALTQGGDNIIIVNAAANAAYGAAEIARADVRAAACLTQFEATLGAIEALFSNPEAGIRILNAAPAIEAGRELLPLADIILLNETELQAFARLPAVPEDEATIAAAARTLIGRPGQHVVVTLGAAGCLHVSAEGQDMIPAFRMTAIDTIGAGDCFCGVFAAALADGEAIPAALRRANAAAALSVTRRGAGESAPHRAEVDALLREGQPA
jgi:ribokinase